MPTGARRWIARLLLLALAIVAGLIAAVLALADNPWRQGVRDIGSDCVRHFTGDPLAEAGAVLRLQAGTAPCGVAFALQRKAGHASRYIVQPGSVELRGGNARLGMAAHDGWQRLDRARSVLAAGNEGAAAPLPLDVAARAGLVEFTVVVDAGASLQLRGLRLRNVQRAAEGAGRGRQLHAQAMDIIARHALNADRLPARAWRHAPIAADATEGEARAAIRQVLRDLDDHHSVLVDPVRLAEMPQRARAMYVAPRWKVLQPGIGHLQVPTVLAADKALSPRYADAIAQALQDGAAQGVRGWVIDLTENTGGSMWPMLGGLEPLLRGQPLGAFGDRQGRLQGWRNPARGRAVQVPDMGAVPVAVVISGQTASAGEAVAVAFRGRRHTRNFGAATRGLSTANRGFPLRDGGVLQLTTAVYVDRDGRSHGGPIVPDSTQEAAQAVPAAAAWLQQQLDLHAAAMRASLGR